MSKEFFIADCVEMKKRKLEAEKLYSIIFEPDEIPFIVTDEATLGSIYLGDENDLIEKIKDQYGVLIHSKHFYIPVWELIDILEKRNNPKA